MGDNKKYVVNDMVSEFYEIFYAEDVVDEEKTLYHMHDFYEIHITLAGKGVFFLDGNFHELDAGTIVLIHSGDLHRIVAQQSGYFERIYMFITPEFLKKYSTKHTDLTKCFEPIGDIKSKIIKTDVVNIIEFIKHSLSIPNSNNYGEDLMYEQALINFIFFINKAVLLENQNLIKQIKPENELINNVIVYINNNLGEDLSLTAVSSKFYISKYHLSHKFKEITGISFHNYVQKKRLYYSKQLLTKYNNATLVYNKCGFESYSYFLKSFKKEYGITPKEFINLSKQGKKLLFNYPH